MDNCNKQYQCIECGATNNLIRPSTDDPTKTFCRSCKSNLELSGYKQNLLITRLVKMYVDVRMENIYSGKTMDDEKLEKKINIISSNPMIVHLHNMINSEINHLCKILEDEEFEICLGRG